MFHTLQLNSRVHQFLNKIDDELAEESRKENCLHCGGKLHKANYPRSPFGLLKESRDFYKSRHSFCCSSCRRRKTSKSVRFFGRRWYVAPVHILINTLILNWNKRTPALIRHHFGIDFSRITWKRWRKWWLKCFKRTRFWKKAKGHIASTYSTGPFPRTLFHMYPLPGFNRLVKLLEFLAPLTAGAFRAV